ncbi:hypothetical protein R3P38DRAFT_1948065 [Favolaschia claudopus]|uniref:Uncharacterized protein n=1 Tax=Favolaschia claudopus TaxID=2862362 RepID=A0AAW0A0U1_9AGAR
MGQIPCHSPPPHDVECANIFKPASRPLQDVRSLHHDAFESVDRCVRRLYARIKRYIPGNRSSWLSSHPSANLNVIRVPPYTAAPVFLFVSGTTIAHPAQGQSHAWPGAVGFYHRSASTLRRLTQNASTCTYVDHALAVPPRYTVDSGELPMCSHNQVREAQRRCFCSHATRFRGGYTSPFFPPAAYATTCWRIFKRHTFTRCPKT